jgi:hypothetical protein
MDEAEGVSIGLDGLRRLATVLILAMVTTNRVA